MAKDPVHRGKTSWWHGTYTTLCGITTPTSTTSWALFGGPNCPACLTVMRAGRRR